LKQVTGWRWDSRPGIGLAPEGVVGMAGREWGDGRPGWLIRRVRSGRRRCRGDAAMTEEGRDGEMVSFNVLYACNQPRRHPPSRSFATRLCQPNDRVPGSTGNSVVIPCRRGRSRCERFLIYMHAECRRQRANGYRTSLDKAVSLYTTPSPGGCAQGVNEGLCPVALPLAIVPRHDATAAAATRSPSSVHDGQQYR
jgi:hypothetical protein